MLEKVKDFYHKYWFLLSTSAIAILYALFYARGQKIRELRQIIEVDKIKTKIDTINRKAIKDDESAKNSQKAYEDLKRRHPSIVSKLGL